MPSSRTPTADLRCWSCHSVPGGGPRRRRQDRHHGVAVVPCVAARSLHNCSILAISYLRQQRTRVVDLALEACRLSSGLANIMLAIRRRHREGLRDLADVAL